MNESDRLVIGLLQEDMPAWRRRPQALERQPWPWFLGILYLSRWLVLGLILLLVWGLAPEWLVMVSAEAFAPTKLSLAFTLLVLAPVGETLLECTALRWLLRTVLRRPPRRT